MELLTRKHCPDCEETLIIDCVEDIKNKDTEAET